MKSRTWPAVSLGLAAALLAAGILLGPRPLWTTLRGARDVARDVLEENKTDVQRAAEIRVGLQDLDDKILAFGDKLAEVEGRARAAERRAHDVEEELGKQRGVLARSRQLLDAEQGTYRIGSHSYSRAEVNADALARLARCEQFTKQLDFERQVVKQLNDAVQEARTNLARARQVRQEKGAELTALEARLENAKLLQQVNELTRDIRTSPLGPQTELAQKFEAFERRVASAERRAGPEPRGGDILDWDENRGVPEARDAIARFLSGKESR
jgi:phage shock protein A